MDILPVAVGKCDSPYSGKSIERHWDGGRSGYRSRRIDDEHRLVHSVSGEVITVVEAR
ncbi:type II toxin-antitoxin system YoeB family toxin [Nocardia aurantiaca]|uniref:Endoribonuclease YoeB n=1 Tax=Nocardia aurantiaca TaxID=2675850 RepID=A0A6I3KW72_9NOCA|nr:hypothetical protein [Nocardia aurantiaca]